MLHLGEELSLADRGLVRVAVTRVQQTLEHHKAVRDVLVAREVDPTQAAVRDASRHLVLTADEIAGLELRRERVRGPALRAEPLGTAVLPRA